MIPMSGKGHTKGSLRACTVFMLILELCLASMSCSGKTDSGKGTADEIHIGVIITTGEERMKTSENNVLDMVRIMLGNTGGVELRDGKHRVKMIVREVDGRIPEQAVRAAKELINQEGAVAIVGPSFSIDAITAGEVAERSGIPLIAPVSINPKTTAGRKYVFRTAFLDDFQAASMARFSRKDLGATRAAVLFNVTNPYCRDLAENFRDLFVQEGGEIVSYETYVPGETDFTMPLKRIQKGLPDVLYLPDYFDEAGPIAMRTREMGIDAVLLGVASWDVEKARDMPQMDGAYMVDYVALDELTGKSGAFVKEYVSRYGRSPQSGTILTYDAFGILLRAIEHAGSSEPEAIRNALYDLGPYEGLAGKIDFIDNGDPEREAVIVQFEDGQVRCRKMISPMKVQEDSGK